MRAPDFSDDRLADDLAAAATDLGEPLTASGYDGWQRERDAASPALLIRRFGSWNEACARAGVATNKTRSTSRRWSDDDVVAIVRTYLTSPGSAGTFADYSAWAKEHDGAPSGATLRQRFSWAEVKRRAST
ncbi:homing endonuclease associated repeat-containing protein [Nocardioides caeni]|uniref:Uncharacterized protein n=1 Tax=Nocardioides caeni TaxID=574700 RepID=A0A4V4HLH8_9ACTN|nr:hypothetical protein [Nocardioides caeni]THV18346.1 hypothetical protein E9934_01535 [Nocardioides caeni]